MFVGHKMSGTAAGIMGDSYRGSNLSPGAKKACFETDDTFASKRPHNNLQAQEPLN